MGFINLPPNVFQYFESFDQRIKKLETAQRFTAPSVATDPTNPRKGDIWLNTTSNTLKAVDNTGAIRTITWV